MALKVVFAGTPTFALPTLQQLIARHDVCAVFTKPDSPAGRGRKISYSAVKQFVLEHAVGLPIFQPDSLKTEGVHEIIRELSADVMVVIAYGMIIPKSLFSLFTYGCINVHASLLPRWRGASPIQRALLAGDKETGVSIMQINEGLDTGDVLQYCSYLIKPTDTAKDVHDALADLGAAALINTLGALQTGQLTPTPQNNQFATIAPKISREEALIDWHQPAIVIDRQVRAFNPWPVAYSYLGGQLLKIWQVKIISTTTQQESAGQIVGLSRKGIDVQTGDGIIRLMTLQIPGGKPMPVSAFLSARSDTILPGVTRLGDVENV